MPKKIIPLSDSLCRSAKPVPGKTLKLFDGGGLFLEVTSHGTKLWRLKYRIAGKERLLSIGTYPQVTLTDARAAKTEARRLIENQIDPSQKKQTARQIRHIAVKETLEGIAREWHLKKSPNWASTHASKVLCRLEKNVFPWLGDRPITQIKPHEILAVLRRVEERGALDSALRIRQYMSMIYRYAIATARAERDMAADLVGALASPIKSNYAFITDPEEIGQLLLAIHTYQGSFITKTALKLAPLLFCRPGELRGMRWDELDLHAATWTLPPARQKIKSRDKKAKNGEDIVFPLATQSVQLLSEIKSLTGSSPFVFPSERSRQRAMSDGTVNGALRRMGIKKEQLTGHGFRHMASTRLNEQQIFSAEAIEVQLSHKGKDVIRGTYNKAKYMEERKTMMQWWADYLDQLHQEAKSKWAQLMRAA